MAWRVMDEGAIHDAASRLNENNEEVFRFIDALEEYPAGGLDDHTPYAQDLMRVETKVNLLLGLVGQLLTVHFPLPANKGIKLTPMGIEWRERERVEPGIWCLFDIYLSEQCPRPLSFPGRVERVEFSDGVYQIQAQFLQLSDPIKDRLEKAIFRHHRRRIAMSRRRSDEEPQSASTTKF